MGNPISANKPSYDYYCHFCVEIVPHENHGTYSLCMKCSVKGTNKGLICLSCNEKRFLYPQNGNRCFRCINKNNRAERNGGAEAAEELALPLHCYMCKVHTQWHSRYDYKEGNVRGIECSVCNSTKVFEKTKCLACREQDKQVYTIAG